MRKKYLMSGFVVLGLTGLAGGADTREEVVFELSYGPFDSNQYLQSYRRSVYHCIRNPDPSLKNTQT